MHVRPTWRATLALGICVGAGSSCLCAICTAIVIMSGGGGG
jgi:hypothetical protein